MPSSPTLRPTPAEMDKDHMQAAWHATLRQRADEEAAASYGVRRAAGLNLYCRITRTPSLSHFCSLLVLSQLTVEEYLHAMDLSPATEFKQRPALMDPIMADHMRAFTIANAKEKQRALNPVGPDLKALNMAAYERSLKKA